MKFIVLALLLSACQSSFAKEATNSYEAVQLLEKVQNDIKKQTLIKTIKCDAANEKCQFTMICDKLRVNRNSKVLYKNKFGQSIPNYQLLNLLENVDQCKSTLIDQEPDSAVIMTAIERKRNALRKEFLDSIATNKEETVLVKVERALLTASLNKLTGDASYGISTELIEKNIRDAESKAKVKLSDSSRSKWINMLDPAAAVVNFNQGATATSTSDNPFITTQLLTNIDAAGSKEKVLAYQAQVQKELNRSYIVFLDTKKIMIEVLNKRKNGQNNSEVDIMIKRLSTVQMSTEKWDSSSCSGPNAFYSPIRHNFNLCPQLMQMPDAALQTIIAHELGHSIDPCIATFPLKTATHIKKNSLENTNLELPFNPTLPRQSNQFYFSTDEGFFKTNVEYDQKKMRTTEIAKSIQLNKNPFSSVISCLQTQGSIQATIGDTDYTKEIIIKKIDKLRKSGASESNKEIMRLKDTLQRLDTIFADKRTCSTVSSPEGPSQIQEVFSDWIAAEVIASKVSTAKNHDDAQRIAFESSGLFAATGCESFDLDISETASKALISAGCNYRGSNYEYDLDNIEPIKKYIHPEDYQRVNNLFLAHPKIANSLSCQRQSGVKYCE